MCGFKPGDEVVCVSRGKHPDWRFLTVGGVYTVSRVYPPEPKRGCEEWGIDLAEVPTDDGLEYDLDTGFWLAQGFLASRFRKVQSRNSCLTIEVFFTVPGGFEEPKRGPAKTPEPAQ